MESTSFKSRFMANINNSFGSGGMSLALNESQFSSFIQFLKKDGLPIKKAVQIIGLQKDEKVWVLGEDLHLDTNGDIIEESNRTYTWLNEICEGLSSMRIEEVLPKIKLPLDTSVLHR